LMSSGEVTAWHYATRDPIRIRWKQGTISEVVAAPKPPGEETWIAPSLFDVQVNGFGGIDFQQDDLTARQILTAANHLRLAGCLRFVPTLITERWPKMTSRLRRLVALKSEWPELESAIAGWHVEGPFLSTEPGFHGAHDPSKMCNPSPEKIAELKAIAGSDPLLLTLAPERPGSIEAIRFAVSIGIKVSLGHTNASAEVLRQAVEAGATGFTHLGNGCPRELDRTDNILWRVFETPGLKVGLIPDGIHVSAPLFRLMHRVLPQDSIYYTSDAMSAAGMPPGRYPLGPLALEVGEDQVVRQPGKQLFAGSALRPIDGVFRAAEMLGVPWQEAWQRFAATPARFLGVENELAAGTRADFCLLRFNDKHEFTTLRTCVNGGLVVD
jgi:N-acetylglucosamine-6-phosphate deacetylase